MCSLTWSHHTRSTDARATRIVDPATAGLVTHERIPRSGLWHELDLDRDLSLGGLGVGPLSNSIFGVRRLVAAFLRSGGPSKAATSRRSPNTRPVSSFGKWPGLNLSSPGHSPSHRSPRPLAGGRRGYRRPGQPASPHHRPRRHDPRLGLREHPTAWPEGSRDRICRLDSKQM